MPVLREDYGIETRIVRFHNIFGPLGTWDGGREKAPAAMCRKVAMAKLTAATIEIWGDGEQTRSFCYIDDCVEGIYRLMRSDYASRSTSAQDRWSRSTSWPGWSSTIAGKQASRSDHVAGPQGVRGRNSDNTRLREVLGWEPGISLEDGLAETYRWIEKQVRRALGGSRAAVVPEPDRSRADPAASTCSACRSARSTSTPALDEIGAVDRRGRARSTSA